MSSPENNNNNPFEALFRTFERISHGVQSQAFRIMNIKPISWSTATSILPKDEGKSANPVSKEELGRATWTFLHTLGAQYPDKPTRQQKRDVKELMEILSRMYPCRDCADHFKEVLRANPVQAGSQAEFSEWLCRVHNVVNRSLGKVAFPCERVDARWGKLECEQRACDLQGTINFGDDEEKKYV